MGRHLGPCVLGARAEASLSRLHVKPDVPGSACSASATFAATAVWRTARDWKCPTAAAGAVAKAETPLPAPWADGQVLRLTATIPDVQLWSPDIAGAVHGPLEHSPGRDGGRRRGEPFRDAPGRGPRPARSLERQAADAARLRRRPRLSRADGHAGGQTGLPAAAAADQVLRIQPRSPPQRDYAAGVLRRVRQVGHDADGRVPHRLRFVPAPAARRGRTGSPRHGPAAAEETYRRQWDRCDPAAQEPPLDLLLGDGKRALGRSAAAARLPPDRPAARSGALFVDTDGLFGKFSMSRRTARRWTSISSCSTCRATRSTIRRSSTLPRPKKPIVSHEQGNFVTFTRPDLIDQFQHNIKPFWLTGGREKLARLGLLGEADRWAEKSERLYLLCHKYDLEALPQEPLHLRLSLVALSGLLDELQRPG